MTKKGHQKFFPWKWKFFPKKTSFRNLGCAEIFFGHPKLGDRSPPLGGGEDPIRYRPTAAHAMQAKTLKLSRRFIFYKC